MKNMTIVDRVVERLKSQPVGDLITEEDLHDIVKEAIPKTFFANRIEDVGGYNGRREKEPYIIEIMRGLLETEARLAVKAYLDENPQIIAEYWKQVCDQNLLNYVQHIMDQQATDSVKMALRTWLDTVNSTRMSRGGAPLPPIYF